jgi:hypothetical protein
LKAAFMASLILGHVILFFAFCETSRRHPEAARWVAVASFTFGWAAVACMVAMTWGSHP